jgi:hypothetical protein
MRKSFQVADLDQQAHRYDLAMQAVAGITTMNVSDPGELRRALAIFHSAGSDLKFLGSKLVKVASNDAVFMGSVRKACPHRAAVDDLLKKVRIDPRAIFGLEGARLLTVRLRQNIVNDARAIARLASYFGEAAANLQPIKSGELADRFGLSPTSPTHKPVQKSRFYTPFADQVARSWERIWQLNDGADAVIFGSLVFTLLDIDAVNHLDLSACLKYYTCMQAGHNQLGQCTAAAHNQIPPNLGLEVQYAGQFADLTLQCGFFALGTSNVMPTFRGC